MKEKPTEKQLFDALISQTAYGIWVSLGKLQNPVSGETSIDLTQASIQIDMLGMINNKMHASLTDEEREYIDKVLAEAKVDESIKVQDWTDDQIAAIREQVGSFTIEGELRSEVQINIKRLMDIGCQRGIRHRLGLPLRGQRTKNNSRTRKGKRKTVANKKK